MRRIQPSRGEAEKRKKIEARDRIYGTNRALMGHGWLEFR